jgi:phosphatidylserine/phosphatidylglycerophosphate/cardiolipin synthase-like enzyme
LKDSTPELTALDVAVRFHIAEELHTKGILGDGYYLAGSMNFTYNGITVNEEALNLRDIPRK